jgi:AbrB family looped-hinge helix DNA binding protein
MYQLKLERQGRLVIPAAIRKAMGLKTGDTLVCTAEPDRLTLKARAAVEQELRASFAKVKGSLAQELIAERRREARRANQK